MKIKDQTITQFLRRLKYERNYSDNTVSAYRLDLIDLSNFLQNNNTNTKEASLSDISDYFDFVTQTSPHSAKTRVRKISCFRSFYKDLMRMELREDNPMEQIDLPKLNRKLPSVVSINELEKIFDFFDNKPNVFIELRDALIFEILYSCGIRVSELCQLTLNHIYIEEDIIRILGKGNKERLIPIGKCLKILLLKYLPIRQEFLNGVSCEYLITSKFKKHVSRMFIWKVINRYSKELQITTLSPHMLRHAFATHMLSNGADLRLIQELLGHSDISTTEIYTHISTKELYQTLIQNHPLAQHSLVL